MADTKIIQPVKKEKKKDKKKKTGSLELEDREKFKPVANPDFNPKLITPFSLSKQEQWTISSTKTIPPVTQKIQQNITPAERQGHAAETYFPRDSYTHLDPTKSNNAYKAFNELQQKFSPPTQIDNKQQQSYKQQTQPQQQQQINTPPPQQQQVNYHNSPPQQQVNYHNSPPRPQSQQKPRRPTHLKDGVKIQSFVRASWSYTAQMPSELSFDANDTFAVIKQQPDGWWYAELLDPKRRARGLVPGNYMIPC